MKFLHRLKELARETFAAEDAGKLESAAFALLLIFTAVAPFLYETRLATFRPVMGGGAVRPTGNMFLASFAFILTAATFLSRSRILKLRPLAVPLGAAIALGILGLLQLLPLPEGALESVAPVSLKIYHDSAEILKVFGTNRPLLPRISIAPWETTGFVLILFSYIGLFLSAGSLLRSRLRRRIFAGVLLASGVIQILFAAVRGPAHGRLHGAFANPNHFAGYLEIILPLAFGILWAEVLTSRDRAISVSDPSQQFERRFLALAGRVIVWGVIAAGIALTESRGGILAAAVTTLTFLTMGLKHPRLRLRRRVAAGVVGLALVVGIAFVFFTAGPHPFARFLQTDPRDFGGETRVMLWRLSLDSWRDFPVFGSGLGTFREAFRRVQPRELTGMVEHAHSDLLQLLVTGGGIGGLLGIILFLSLFVLLVRAWRAQRHREESAIALAGVGALLSLTLHGLVDFNLSIPPIPATLACVLGMAWAAGRE